MSSRSTLVILIWKSNEMIQPDEKVSEQDINVIQLPDQSGRLDTGLVKIGKFCVIACFGFHNGVLFFKNTMETEMTEASIRLSWQASPSVDVQSYLLRVVEEGENITNPFLLEKCVTGASRYLDFKAEQGSTISASVVATDGKVNSQPRTTTFVVPELEPLSPPSDVLLTVIDPIG